MKISDFNNKFLLNNFNKIVIYQSLLGRLIGGFFSDSGFHYVILDAKGNFQSTLYENHIYILKENKNSFHNIFNLYSCPAFEKPIIKDFRGQLLYSKDKNLAIKAKATSLFNKIITSNGNICRVVGFSIEDDGYFLITYDLEGKKSYLEIISHYEDSNLNTQTLSYLDKIIPKEDEILEEYSNSSYE